MSQSSAENPVQTVSLDTVHELTKIEVLNLQDADVKALYEQYCANQSSQNKYAKAGWLLFDEVGRRGISISLKS